MTITGGKGAGVLHRAGNNAAGLLGSTAVTGQVNIKWAVASPVKLTSRMSTVTVTVFTSGTDAANGYATLDILAGNGRVSGDFSGGDAGANTTLHAESGQTVADPGRRLSRRVLPWRRRRQCDGLQAQAGL